MQPNVIQNPVVNERLYKFTGSKQQTVTPTLSPELVAVVIVDDLSKTGKGGAVTSVRPWSARSSGTAGVGNFPFVRVLNNQVLSATVQRIRKLTICSLATGQPVYVHLLSGVIAGAPTPNQKGYVDGRLEGIPGVDIRFLDSAIGPDLTTCIFEGRLVNGGPLVIDFPNPIVLPPNVVGGPYKNLLTVSLSVAGSLLSCTVEGEEEGQFG